MTQYSNPPPLPSAPPSSPGLLFPVVVGGLVAAIVHALGIPIPEAYCVLACSCGLSGLPGGLIAAGIAASRDRSVRAGKGFTAAFLAGLLGAAIVGGILLARGYEPPEHFLEEMRRGTVEVAEQEGYSEQETQDLIEGMEIMARAAPWVSLGVQVLVGALAGMVLALLMNRRPPANPYPPQGYQGYPPQGPPPYPPR